MSRNEVLGGVESSRNFGPKQKNGWGSWINVWSFVWSGRGSLKDLKTNFTCHWMCSVLKIKVSTVQVEKPTNFIPISSYHYLRWFFLLWSSGDRTKGGRKDWDGQWWTALICWWMQSPLSLRHIYSFIIIYIIYYILYIIYYILYIIYYILYIIYYILYIILYIYYTSQKKKQQQTGSLAKATSNPCFFKHLISSTNRDFLEISSPFQDGRWRWARAWLGLLRLGGRAIFHGAKLGVKGEQKGWHKNTNNKRMMCFVCWK